MIMKIIETFLLGGREVTQHQQIEEEFRKLFKPIENKIRKLLDFLVRVMRRFEK